MTLYLDRSAWTSSAASGDRLSGTLLRGVAVHWPGTSQDRIGDPGQAAIAERLRHYRSYHIGKGWRDIGYNVAIDQAGRVWELRTTLWKGNLVGAHCASPSNPDANREYVGVLLLLGDAEALSDAMIAAFRDWYHTWFLFGWPNRYDVRGHGQVLGAETACPGPFVRAVVRDLTVPGSTQEDEMTPAQEELLRYVSAQVKATAQLVVDENRASTKAIMAGLQDVPGVNIDALAAELNRLDATSVADELAARLQA
jgi:hypothetical protein